MESWKISMNLQMEWDLEKNPSLNALYQCNLGRLLYLEWYHKGVPHEAHSMEQAFQASLTLNPSDPFTHCWYGTFLKEIRQDIESARREYEEALRIGRESKNPKLRDHPLFLNNIGLLLIYEVQEGLRPPGALIEAERGSNERC